MELSFAMHISVPENVLMRELEGESVILNVDTERYFGLDDMGTRMLTVLTASDSIQSAYNALLNEAATRQINQEFRVHFEYRTIF